MEEKPSLRPCPFCGSSTLTVKRNMELDGMTFIVCEPCGAVASFCGAEQLAPAIKAWNARSPVVSCDGGHAAPACSDPQCWRDD